MTKITVRYSTIDRFRETRTFKTLKGARAYAVKLVGEHPDHGGTSYAVSFDGIGKIEVEGCTLRELFTAEIKPSGPYEVHVGSVNEDRGTTSFYLDSSFATLAEANARANDLDAEGVDGLRLIGTTDEAKAAIAKQQAEYEAQMQRDWAWERRNDFIF